MITNYKINQPFTSDFSVEKERKIPVALEITEPAELSTMLKPFLRRRQKSQWKENHTVATLWEPIRSGLDRFIFLVPFKESRFPLFGISIEAGKRSSRSITERSCATGIDFFYKAQASNFQRRPWSHAANQLGMNAPESFSNLACFNTILYFGKRGRENQREMKPGDL